MARAYVKINVAAGKERLVRDALLERKEVRTADLTSGDQDIIALVEADSFDELLDILMGFTPYVEPGDLLPSAISCLDLGHLERGQAVEVAQRMGQALREEVRLAPAIGPSRRIGTQRSTS